MIYRLVFIALLISVLPSCTHEFSLTEVDAERKIVLFLYAFYIRRYDADTGGTKQGDS